jgi:hypothetical protein
MTSSPKPTQHNKTNKAILAVVSLLAFMAIILCLFSSYKACRTSDWQNTLNGTSTLTPQVITPSGP